jgi:hypothetical protein
MSAAVPPTGGSSPPRQGWSAALIGGILVIAAGILFWGIYVLDASDQHFGALIWIGSLSLVFAIVAYLTQSLSRNPAAQRSIGVGFLGMGFTTLFLSIGLGPTYGVESFGSMIIGLIALLIILVVVVAGVAWRGRLAEAAKPMEAARATWRAEAPVSALSYASANSPNVPATAPAPSSPSSPPPPRSP